VNQRTPRSRGSIAAEIFGALWGVITLACAHDAPDFLAAPGERLRQFLQHKRDEVRLIVEDAATAAELPDGVMSRFDELGPIDPGGERGEEFFRGWLALYTRGRAPYDIDFADEPLLRRLLAHGIECQLAELIGAFVLSIADRPQAPDRRLAAAVASATRTARLTGHAQPEALVLACYGAWCSGTLGTILMPTSDATDEARSGLRSITIRLDRLLGRGDWLEGA
jgi:hypothetical protein